MFSDDVPVQEAKSAELPAPAAEETLIKRFEVSASKDEIERELNRLAQQYSQKVKIPGFRQGKVPVEVVKSTYKKALTDEVIEELIRKLAFAKIENEKMPIAMTPVAEKVDYAEGGDLKALIAVEVFPDVPLPEIEGLEVAVPKEQLKIEEYDEAKQIDNVLRSRERSVPVKDRGLQDSDLALFSLQVRFLDNKRMSAKKDAYFLLKKEGESEIPGLYEEILGKKVGDKISLTRRYPEDFKKKAWAGKEVEHHLEIKNIYELKKPELDQEFFKSIGVASEEEFKKKLREEFDHHLTHHRDDVIMEHIFNALIEKADFPIPASLVQQEIRSRLSRQQAPIKFANDGEKAKFREDLLAGARKSIKLSLILDEIRKKYLIEVKDADIQKEYHHLSQHHGLPEKDIKKYYANKERFEQLKSQLLDVKVTEFIKGKVKIKEV